MRLVRRPLGVAVLASMLVAGLMVPASAEDQAGTDRGATEHCDNHSTEEKVTVPDDHDWDEDGAYEETVTVQDQNGDDVDVTVTIDGDTVTFSGDFDSVDFCIKSATNTWDNTSKTDDGRDISYVVVYSVTVDEEPEVDPCDPADRPDGMSIGEWLENEEFTGSDCFDVEIIQACGSLDVQVTSHPGEDLGWTYAAVWTDDGDVVLPDDANSFPAEFGEGEGGGSVDVTWYLVGPEGDYLKGFDLPNYWDDWGETISVNTNCEDDEPTPEPEPEPETEVEADVVEPSASIEGVCVEDDDADTKAISYVLDNTESNVDVTFTVQIDGEARDIEVAAGDETYLDYMLDEGTLDIAISVGDNDLVDETFDQEICVPEVAEEVVDEPEEVVDEPEEVDVKGEVEEEELPKTGASTTALAILGLLGMAAGSLLLRRRPGQVN